MSKLMSIAIESLSGSQSPALILTRGSEMVCGLTSRYRRRERGMGAIQRLLPASDLGVGQAEVIHEA